MKTGGVKDSGDGSDPHLEIDGWTPWQYHVPEEDLEQYYSDANALMMRVKRMPAAVRARLERIDIRCPAKGCLLAVVYWMPRRPTAEELEPKQNTNQGDDALPPNPQPAQPGYLLYVGRTAGGTEVYDIVNYMFNSRLSPNSRVLYWRAGCRHGTASIRHGFIQDVFSIAGRWRHLLQTEAEAVASLPEYLRPFWGKRVFHPEPSAWHPKRQQPPG